MGTVIRFPEERRQAPGTSVAFARPSGPSIVILPVIRIERHVDEATRSDPEVGAPDSGRGGRRGRRN